MRWIPSRPSILLVGSLVCALCAAGPALAVPSNKAECRRITRQLDHFVNVAEMADTRNVMITSIHDFVDVRRVEGYRLHNLGSNLYHLMMLATGRCEAIITGPCYLWDMAPALPFTRAAGHVERYLDGSPFDIGSLMKPDYGFPVKRPLIVGPPDEVDRLLGWLG